MNREIPFDGRRLRSVQRVRDLDGVTLTIELQWLPRLSGWYADVRNAEGDLIVAGRRVEPGAASLIPDLTSPGVPPGVLIADGPEVYDPSALGSLLTIEYLPVAMLVD